jgi:hypothetical protein
MRSKLSVADEKRGQFPLLTVCFVPVRDAFFYQFLKPRHSFLYACILVNLDDFLKIEFRTLPSQTDICLKCNARNN